MSITLLTIFSTLFIHSFAANLCVNQSETFSYLAAAYDEKGDLIIQKDIKVRVNLLANDVHGHLLYSEEHMVTTDEQGLFSLYIGEGEKIQLEHVQSITHPEKIYMKLEIKALPMQTYRTLRSLKLPFDAGALYTLVPLVSKT